MTINLLGYRIEIKKEVAAVIITSLVFLAGVGGYLIVKGNSDIIIDTGNEEKTEKLDKSGKTEKDAATGSTDNEAPESGTEEKKKDEIKIYVIGCVNNPGVITLEKGQLIDDAVRLAGGFTKDADPGSVNLVYKLEENLMLHIKSKEDIKKELQEASETGAAGEGARIEKGSGGAVVNEKKTAAASGGKVNINTASVSELDSLNGIGEAKARDIISYREMNGPFKTIEDIMKVPGIKTNSFNSIKDSISVK